MNRVHPQNFYVKVPTSSTSERDCVWRQGLQRRDSVKTRSSDELRESKFLLFESPSLWYAVMAALMS